ncbi:MAG: hypothetical protein AAGL98_03145 [Planctomycetota bacterium]
MNELATTLRGMSEKQKFSVIVFDGQDVKEVPPRGLRRATADAKAKTIAWLKDTRNVQNMGSGDAVKALQLAFQRRPELIFLLSQNLYNPGSGKYEIPREELLDLTFQEASRKRKQIQKDNSLANIRDSIRGNTVINTIEFNDVDDLAYEFDPVTNQRVKVRPSLMEEIARITGGDYMFIQTNVVE